jgi:ribosome-binding protein aMBF1 (putative translation factor)
MRKVILDLTPQNKEEERALAEENFRLNIQYAILDAMEEKGICRSQLAKNMGVEEATISRYFSDECNISVRELGNIFHAIGFKCKISLVK